MSVTILNSPIVTSFGTFLHYPIGLAQAKTIAQRGFTSAIGHQSTAEIISTLLDVDCPVNRITYHQLVGDIALIFKLNERAPEGAILSKKDIHRIGYSWYVIEKKL